MQDLKTKIMADVTDFIKKMNQVKGSVKKTSSAFKQLGAALSAAFIVRGISNFVSKLDTIGKHAKRLQMSTDDYQKFAFAAERSGAAVEDVEMAMKKTDKQINDAKRGLSTAKYAFDELGISFEALDKMSQTEKLQKLALALDLMTNKSRKTALAVEFMGRSGMKLIPMFRDLNKLFAEAESIGIIDAKQIKAAEELEDKVTNLKTAMTSLVASSGMVDFLNDLAAGANNYSNELAKITDDTMKLQEQLKQAGGTGPGLEHGIGAFVRDMFTFGLADKERDHSFTLPPPKVGDMARYKKDLQEKITATNNEIVKREAEAAEKTEIMNKQKNAISDVDRKAAEAESKKIDKLKVELSLLEARANLSDEAFERKKQEILLQERLNNATSQGQKDFIMQQDKYQKMILEKSIDEGKFSSGASSIDTSDRLRRIGVTVGNIVNPADTQRNVILRQITTKLEELKTITKNKTNISRAV